MNNLSIEDKVEIGCSEGIILSIFIQINNNSINLIAVLVKTCQVERVKEVVEEKVTAICKVVDDVINIKREKDKRFMRLDPNPSRSCYCCCCCCFFRCCTFRQPNLPFLLICAAAMMIGFDVLAKLSLLKEVVLLFY